MQRALFSLLLVLFLAQSALAQENREKSPKGVPAKAEKAAPKGAASKELPIPDWVPKQYLGTPVATRLAQIQADLDAAQAKLGPAREEAHKAQQAAHLAQNKADDLQRKVKWLESEKFRVLENGAKQQREATLDKRDFENEQKIKRLEAQVRELMARLDAATKQTPPTAKPAPVTKQAPAKK